MERAAAERKYHQIHEEKPFHDGTFHGWSKERTDAAPYHFMDGVTIWVASEDLEPDATWLVDNRPRFDT